MTQESYPLLTNADPQQVADTLREIARLRERDIEDFANLKNVFMRGRKVAKIPTASTDIVATDREGDFNFDVDYVYICVGTGSGLAWRRTAVESWVAPFTPSDISNLGVWWDLNDTSTLWADTAATTPATSVVARVDDKSSNGYNGLQATGGREPSTGVRTINSLNALDFNSSNLNHLDIASFSSGQPYTIFWVGETDDTSSLTRYYIDGIGASDRAILFQYTQKFSFYAGTIVPGSVTIDTSPHILVGVYDGASSQLYVDGGSAAASGNIGAQEFLSGIRVGIRQNLTNAHNGSLGEFILYEKVCSLAEINQCAVSLAAKWGISWTEAT